MFRAPDEAISGIPYIALMKAHLCDFEASPTICGDRAELLELTSEENVGVGASEATACGVIVRVPPDALLGT